MRVMVTGAAGFIGAALGEALLARGDEVIGVDNLDAYYDTDLKRVRLARLTRHRGFADARLDISDAAALDELFSRLRPQRVVNLAAQVGVRYSLVNPSAYVQSNLVGFANVLECCRRHEVEHLVYASSSSVYGATVELPHTASRPADHPVSLYAATKRSNELMAHSYSHLFGLPTTGLRFFTVYGPWGRPDMAYYLFTRKILAGEPIDLFNGGLGRRDFTYIDDIVQAVARVLDRPATRDPGQCPGFDSSAAPWRIYNVGNHTSVPLGEMIEILERLLGRRAERRLLSAQPGDMDDTYADVGPLAREFGFQPATALATGLDRFVGWYRDYHRT